MTASQMKIPPLVLGGNVFGWNVDEAASLRLLDAAAERGLNCVDTADIYSHWAPGNSGGESETIVGKWLKSRGRGNVIVHTKGGAPGAPGELANANLTAAYLSKAIEASLRRLQTDYIDLYYVHFDDKVTPPEETLRCFEKFIQQGKIRAIGASNYDPARLLQSLEASKALGLPQFCCLQTHYNLYDRAVYEDALEPLCVAQGLGMLSYFSLAKGFLSGKYRSMADVGASKARGGGMGHYLNARGLKILEALTQVAASHSASPAQVALAWLMARPSVTAPIASATTLAQVEELFQATKLVLSSQDIAKLDLASAAAAG